MMETLDSSGERLHLLHVMPSFAPGGAQVRTAQIMNHLGSRYRHTLVSLDGDFSAAERLDPAVQIRCVPKSGKKNPVEAVAWFGLLFRARQPHVVLTYNWGSIDAVVAARLTRIGPVIHTEDGFGQEEALHQKQRRVLFRRLVLRNVYRVVAPSRALIETMLRVWRLPAKTIEHIPNGIDLSLFRPRGAVESTCPGSRELVVGTVGHLRDEKRQELLVRACAALARTEPLRLVIVGDGPRRSFLEAVAREAGFAGQVTFLGNRRDVPNLYHTMDLFALTSSTEQMPLSVLEAMASGLAVVSTDVGDIRAMVSLPNKPFVTSSLPAFHEALARLVREPTLRASVGEANRAHAEQAYGIEQMFQRYDKLLQLAVRHSAVAGGRRSGNQID